MTFVATPGRREDDLASSGSGAPSVRRSLSDDDLLLAGQRVSPGRYRQLEGARRILHLEQEDILPSSLDGRVAVYELMR